MVKEIQTPDDLKAFEAEVRAQNKHDLTKRHVRLVGGAGHDSEFDIPNGVTELSVETAFGVHWYLRNPENELEFIPRIDIS